MKNESKASKTRTRSISGCNDTFIEYHLFLEALFTSFRESI